MKKRGSKGLLVLVLILVGVACQSSKSSEQSVGRNVTKPVSAHVDDEAFNRLNTILFEDFLNDNYGPHAIRANEGHMVLDSESYQSYLKLINIFDQSFIEAEMMRIQPCSAALDTLKFTGEIEAEWAPEVCAFDILYWIGGHEKPDGFEVKDLKIEEADAVSTMVFFDNSDNVQLPRAGSIMIEYRKQNDGWKILKLGKSR
ncbi:hypothetical protein [Pseudochryseolinea flava]|uniref:hypothetical protein n=1 Tax=Pseudochryseolinea flava TaxID=2059302 RepID=UPI0010576B3F|nr:hypothetical protein [Pseudochryseolinea flava]